MFKLTSFWFDVGWKKVKPIVDDVQSRGDAAVVGLVFLHYAHA